MFVVFNCMMIFIGLIFMRGVGYLVARFMRNESMVLLLSAMMMALMIDAAEAIEERFSLPLLFSNAVTAFALLNMWWTCRDWSARSAERDRNAIP